MSRCVSDKTLSQYADGELSPEAARRVDDHLAACPRCAAAVESLRRIDADLRREAVAEADTPDLAARVTQELQRRGAFFKARVAAGKRRLFGEGLAGGRMAGAVVAAAAIVFLSVAGADYLTRDRWARKSAPVLADAERVLVRLVYVESPRREPQLAWAREEVRKLGLSERLAEVRSGAGPALAGDFARLEKTFALLARAEPLPPDLEAQLAGGQLLQDAVRLQERVAAGG